MWLVTPYGAVTEVLRNPALRNDSEHSTILDTFGPQMLSCEGEQHRRYKRACQAPFTVAEVARSWRPVVESHCRNLVDGLGAHSELMSDLAGPLALQSIGSVLGLPAASLPSIYETYQEFAASLANFTGNTSVRSRGKELAEDLRSELAQMLDHAGSTNSPSAQTLIDRLRENQTLDRGEKTRNLLIVLFGGIETTESMIGNLFHAILSHPPLWEELVEARSEGRLVAATVEESMRWQPAVQTLTRHACQETTVLGQTIAPGEIVQCMLAGAHRDPLVFPNPDEFSPQRYLEEPPPARHLGFGLGAHFCLGAPLARLQATLAVSMLLERAPELSFDPDRRSRVRGYEFRRPETLHVLLEPSTEDRKDPT